ncbi:MAG: hypothetical protein DRH57_01820 [Candidatus Cloacimonadota bacterium]|nr:MAG: hypothetical protein DRH57_01820 [Candidatus Cloacimonadota bacterium]
MKKIIVLLFYILILIILLNAQEITISKEAEEYILKRGDRLSIEVMDHPEFTKKVRILPDGTIEYPILGNMLVAGLSPKQLGDVIKHNLEPYVPIPVVTVYVTEIYGESINIIGYVNSPGTYQIYEPLDIPTALSKAGGIQNIRKVKYLKILRKNGEVIKIKLSSLWETEKIIVSEESKLKLYAGDTLIVPPPKEFNWSMLNAFISIIALSLSIYNTLK